MGVDVSLEQALEYCLQELTETGNVEASLRRYPQYVDQLRPQLELAQATRVLYRYVPEAPGGLKAGRERMLAVAAEQRKRGVHPVSNVAATPSVRRWKLAPLRFLALALTAALAVVILGSGFVWAGSQSLPGDLLYPVKLATEDVRTTLASTPAERVELALGFVEERIDEAQGLVDAERPVPDKLIGQIQDHIEQALTQASNADDLQTQPLLAQISTRTRAQIQVLERLRANAPDRDQRQLERAAVTCRRGAEAADEGLQDPQEFRRRQQHRLTDETLTSEPEQEPQQPGAEKEPRDEPQLLTATPLATRVRQATATPTSLQATATPHATRQAPRATATRQENLQGPEATVAPAILTATATPREPQGPKASSTPQSQRATNTPETLPGGPEVTAAPRNLEVTPTPHATPQGPGATGTPQGTSQGNQAEPGQTSPTNQPEPPGSGNSGK